MQKVKQKETKTEKSEGLIKFIIYKQSKEKKVKESKKACLQTRL